MTTRQHFGGTEHTNLPYEIVRPYVSPKRYYSPTRKQSIIT